jgi:hypothetical protein
MLHEWTAFTWNSLARYSRTKTLNPPSRAKVACARRSRVQAATQGPKSGGCLVGLGPNVGTQNTATGAVHVPHESGRLRASETPGCAQFRHQHNMTRRSEPKPR